jgi:hypothetical protein
MFVSLVAADAVPLEECERAWLACEAGAGGKSLGPVRDWRIGHGPVQGTDTASARYSTYDG